MEVEEVCIGGERERKWRVGSEDAAEVGINV